MSSTKSQFCLDIDFVLGFQECGVSNIFYILQIKSASYLSKSVVVL